MSRKSRFAAIPGMEQDSRRRPARVADLIRSEVAQLLLGKIKDPRVHNVTITSVTVTNDLRLARIFYSVFGGNDTGDVEKGLASAKGFIRSHLARALNMRYAPDIIFKPDSTALQQENIERLLREIEEENDKSTS